MKSAETAGTLEATSEVGQTFFVAPDGDDGNDGSIRRPFATIEHALEVARNSGDDGGDRIHLRGGTYRPTTSLLLLEHGGPQRWSRLAAWRNEPVVIDGSRIAPVDGRPTPLILVEGSYYEIAGLQLAGAPTSGISIYGAHIRAVDNVIRDCVWGAVWSDPIKASCLFFARNVVAHNCLMNSRRHLAGGWPSAVNLSHHGDVIVDNHIYENYGEGIGMYGSHHYVAHNNVHDNFSAELYLNNATDTTVRANFVHSRNNPELFRDWNLVQDWTKAQPFWAPAQGIAMANESATDVQFARNRVVHNIVIGRRYRSLNWWNGFPARDGSRNGGLVDSLIAHNTVVGEAEALFHIDDNHHPGTQIRDNVLVQRRGDRPLTDFHGVRGIAFSHNLRYGGRSMGPAGEGRGPGDIEQDPRLVDSGGPSSGHHRLRSDSPAINAASSSAVDLDYFGNARPYGKRNDMGAHEWSRDD